MAAGASRGMRRQCPAMEREAREEAATARVTAEQNSLDPRVVGAIIRKVH